MSSDGVYQSKQWKVWLDSPEGSECAKGVATGQYLENRLWRAFMDGFNAAMEMKDGAQ